MKAKAKTKKPSKKQQQKKIIITAIAVGAAGILGFFGWKYWQKRKAGKPNTGSDLDDELKTLPVTTTNISSSIPGYSTVTPVPKVAATPKATNISSSVFPLKNGSKGELVRQLQQALIEQYGKSILPKYGADGDFGTETTNALKKAGLPTSIDQSTFNVLVQNAGADAATLGKELYSAASAKDFNKVIAILKKLRNTSEYSAANEAFKMNPLGMVRQTIVNGLLNTFTNENQKQQIRFEFLRMGLQYDGNKWSLSGLDGLPIITIIPATVWINATKGVKVPARMVLGNEICKRLDYTMFQNKGKRFLVRSKCVKHL